MHVRIYACMYTVYTFVYIYMCVYLCIHVLMSLRRYIYIYKYLCMYAGMCVGLRMIGTSELRITNFESNRSAGITVFYCNIFPLTKRFSHAQLKPSRVGPIDYRT